MNRKRKISFFLFSLLVIVCLYFYVGYYNREYLDINEISAGVEVSSKDLISSFTANEELANEMYKNKIIEVHGTVKDITFLNNRNTVLLYGDTKLSNVLCDMESNQIEAVKKLKQGQQIKLKGVCKGFLKDAILLNCVLINTKNQ